MSAHTPGPWVVEGLSICGGVDGMTCIATLEDDGGYEATTLAEIEANAERIVSCFNACDGIVDPATALKAAREALAFYAACADTGTLHLAGGDTAQNALNLLLTPKP